MKFFKSIFLLAILAIIAACASDIRVNSEYNSATNFNDFKYYRWHEGEHAEGAVVNKVNNKVGGKEQQVTELLDQNIRLMIDQQLAAKGMVQKLEGQVDFLVDYSIGVAKVTDVNKQLVKENYAQDFQAYTGFGYAGQYYSGAVVSIGTRTAEELTIDRYREGTMMLDFFEPEKNQLIWRAIADKRLEDQALPPEERAKLLKEVINELLGKFPPK